VSIGLYLPGRRANAGHCLRLHSVTGKVHPIPAIHRSQALLAAVWIDDCNHHRRHSALAMMSPVDYEKTLQAGKVA
jgi:hypothetical protein